MSEPLAQYRRMRDFTGTREPAGKAPRARRAGDLSFVVQRHEARALRRGIEPRGRPVPERVANGRERLLAAILGHERGGNRHVCRAPLPNRLGEPCEGVGREVLPVAGEHLDPPRTQPDLAVDRLVAGPQLREQDGPSDIVVPEHGA